MAETKPRFITPVGEAKWAHLHKPRPGFTDDKGRSKGDPKYMIDVVFDPAVETEWAAWAKKLGADIKALPIQTDKKTGQPMAKQSPLKRELDANDQPTGRWYVTFKTSDKFKPGVFDEHGRPVAETVLVGNGSRVRVNYTPDTYEAFGGGITLYLNAVQVVKLVEYQARDASAYGFPVEAPLPPTDDDFPDAPPGDDDSSLPF